MNGESGKSTEWELLRVGERERVKELGLRKIKVLGERGQECKSRRILDG